MLKSLLSDGRLTRTAEHQAVGQGRLTKCSFNPKLTPNYLEPTSWALKDTPSLITSNISVLCQNYGKSCHFCGIRWEASFTYFKAQWLCLVWARLIAIFADQLCLCLFQLNTFYRFCNSIDQWKSYKNVWLKSSNRNTHLEEVCPSLLYQSIPHD